jgi:hypothetical protein
VAEAAQTAAAIGQEEEVQKKEATTTSHPVVLHETATPARQQDVKFGAANLPAMNFIGGGAKTPQAWLDFLGEVKDKRAPPIGSPFQLNFNPNRTDGQPGPPDGISPAKRELPTCGDAALTCSCADCPAAPGCALVRRRVCALVGWLVLFCGRVALQLAEALVFRSVTSNTLF